MAKVMVILIPFCNLIISNMAMSYKQIFFLKKELINLDSLMLQYFILDLTAC